MVKVRQDKQVINKSIYLVLGINMHGCKELLGLWMSENEGAKFWLGVLTELKSRRERRSGGECRWITNCLHTHSYSLVTDLKDNAEVVVCLNKLFSTK